MNYKLADNSRHFQDGDIINIDVTVYLNVSNSNGYLL